MQLGPTPAQRGIERMDAARALAKDKGISIGRAIQAVKAKEIEEKSQFDQAFADACKALGIVPDEHGLIRLSDPDSDEVDPVLAKTFELLAERGQGGFDL